VKQSYRVSESPPLLFLGIASVCDEFIWQCKEIVKPYKISQVPNSIDQQLQKYFYKAPNSTLFEETRFPVLES
jgi:hypothetical protein